MMTLNKIYYQLRKNNQGQYLLLGFCIFLSVLLLSSFSLMYYGPTVQEFLPEGGDTRKMASLLLSVTVIGCFVFTVYASSLFFRYKSREYGVFMALGMEKGVLRRLLFRELLLLTVAASMLGLICAIPVSFGIWKFFELFIISNDQMVYRFGLFGFVPGVVFAAALACMLGIAGMRFVKRADIMEILRTQQKTETVKEIPSWTFLVGVVLAVAGILVGGGGSQFAARVLHIGLPPAFSLVYLLSIVGIYFMLLSIVAQSRLKKNKKKYYNNLVSISLMRFMAKSTTWNMCVIVLLLFACCFSVFYGMQYSMGSSILEEENSKAFSMHYPLTEQQIDKTVIWETASRYQLDILDYTENQAANLVISFNKRDYNEETSRYIDVYEEGKQAALFIQETDFEALSGQRIQVAEGTYITVTETDFYSFWEFADGLQEAQNPDTGAAFPLKFAGTVEYQPLTEMSSPFVYIVNDKDYQEITQGLSAGYLEQMVFFNVSDIAASYDFAIDLLKQYIAHCSSAVSHLKLWDIWAQKLADDAGEEYMYDSQLDMTGNMYRLISDWKYAPQFMVILVQDRMQLISVYVMLSIYIFIISLAAVAIMTYVRSISVATDNKALFESLEKLGADSDYRRMVLKKQLAKIFRIPASIGCGLGFLFSLCMQYFNDGRLMPNEIPGLAVLAGIIIVVLGLLYGIYRYAMRKAEGIVGIRM